MTVDWQVQRIVHSTELTTGVGTVRGVWGILTGIGDTGYRGTRTNHEFCKYSKIDKHKVLLYDNE